MKNLAPEITRQRLLLEGFYAVDMSREVLKRYLIELAGHLELRAYGEPVIFAPAAGMGKEQNQGFDAFIPLMDSGISAYIWSKSRFFSIVIYTCKTFDEKSAVDFTRKTLAVAGEIAEMAF